MARLILDPQNGKVVEILFASDDKVAELVALYNAVSPLQVKEFKSVDEGMAKTLAACERRFFPTRHAPAARKEGPVAKAHAVFDQTKGAPRKDAVAAAIEAGVNPATAATQYQVWRKRQGLSAAHAPNPEAPPTPAPQQH